MIIHRPSNPIGATMVAPPTYIYFRLTFSTFRCAAPTLIKSFALALQHTPDPEKAFKSLAELLRPGGESVVDVSKRGLTSLLHWKRLLRPFTRRMDKRALYRVVTTMVPLLLPAARSLRRLAGRAGARLVPIVEYSHMGLPRELNEEWAIVGLVSDRSAFVADACKNQCVLHLGCRMAADSSELAEWNSVASGDIQGIEEGLWD